MKRMASVRKRSNGSGILTRFGKPASRYGFVVCIDNAGYEASLERNKLYLALKDHAAEADGDMRIVDESGEDYLYSRKRFVPLVVPATVRASVRKASAA
jgi:hypothetical protein